MGGVGPRPALLFWAVSCRQGSRSFAAHRDINSAKMCLNLRYILLEGMGQPRGAFSRTVQSRFRRITARRPGEISWPPYHVEAYEQK